MLREVLRATDASFGICEREAIAKCKAAEPPNPAILVEFWFEWDRQRGLRGYEDPVGLVGDFRARAERICGGTRWAVKRDVETEERGIRFVVTYEGILEVSTDGVRDAEGGALSTEGQSPNGQGHRRTGGECIQEDGPSRSCPNVGFLPLCVTNRSGEKLYMHSRG